MGLFSFANCALHQFYARRRDGASTEYRAKFFPGIGFALDVQLARIDAKRCKMPLYIIFTAGVCFATGGPAHPPSLLFDSMQTRPVPGPAPSYEGGLS
jgi:hypothetical protein